MRMFRAGIVVSFLVALVLVFSFGCAKKLVPATEVVYQGDIEGNYESSEDVLEQVLGVRDCMGFTERPFPLPTIVGMSGGDGVQCGDNVYRACYSPGIGIIIPQDAELELVAHEAVHHYLYLDTGDIDATHNSPFFLKCGGRIKAE